MDVSEQVVTIIYQAIDEANEVRPKHEWIEKSREEQLVGTATKLDSLSLLNLVVAVEERVNEKFETTIDLSTLLALDPGSSPLRSVSTLAQHLVARLQAKE